MELVISFDEGEEEDIWSSIHHRRTTFWSQLITIIVGVGIPQILANQAWHYQPSAFKMVLG